MAKPPGRLGRLARLGRLTGRVTGSYVAQKVKGAFQDEDRRERALKRLHLDNAEEMAQAMGRLKGAAMKLGQAAAVAASGLDLSPEVQKALSGLHNKAEPVPFKVIKEDIENQLEMPLSEAFLEFNEEPLGTASLGQAHVARLPGGREVVVKVLHRGIENSVASDLMALKAILRSGQVIRRDKEEVDIIFDEIRERLEEELDYLQEAANIAEFGRMFAGDPDIRIPEVHPSHSTERVLTLDRLPGVHIDGFAPTASPEARQRAGVTLGRLYYRMAFEHRTLHADPHPGNYLFEPDGRVGLLDFGCVKRFDEFWIAQYSRVALASHVGDRALALSLCKEMDIWVGNDPAAGDALWAFCDSMAQPFRMGRVTVGGSEDDSMERIKPTIKTLLRFPELRATRHIVFLHRSLGGIYALSRQLSPVEDWGVMMNHYCKQAVAVAEGRG